MDSSTTRWVAAGVLLWAAVLGALALGIGPGRPGAALEPGSPAGPRGAERDRQLEAPGLPGPRVGHVLEPGRRLAAAELDPGAPAADPTRRSGPPSVLVVDSAGRPVPGVPVELRPEPRGAVLLREATGADGRLVLRDLDAHFERARRIERRPFLCQLHAVLGLPVAAPASVVLRQDDAVDGPARLVLPETGSLRVRLVDPEGRLLHGRAAGYVAAERAEGQERGLEAEGGEIAVPFAQVGIDLRVFARLEGYGRASTVVRLERPGERRTVEFVFEAPLPVLLLHLVDPKGRPVVARDVEARIAATSERWHVPTDRVGRLRLPMRGEFDPPGTLELLAAAQRGRPAGFAAVLLSGLVPGGNSLGTVRLEPVPCIAAGRVIDASGRAIEGATVGARFMEPDASGRAAQFSAGTDRLGHFRIDGPLGRGGLQLVAQADGYAAQVVEARPGEAWHELRLEREGSVEGSLRSDRDDPPTRFLLELARVAPGAPTVYGGAIHPEPDGRFAFSGLAPGEYELRLMYPDRIQGKVVGSCNVHPGEVCREPAFQQIDPSDHFDSVTLEVVDEEGPVGSTGHVHFGDSGNPARGLSLRSRLALEGGRVRIATRSSPIDVEVCVPGYVPERLERVPCDGREVSVLLRRAPTVRLVLEQGVPLPRGVELWVTLTHAQAGADLPCNCGSLGERPENAEPFVPARRPLRTLDPLDLQLSAPGFWRVGYELRAENAKGRLVSGLAWTGERIEVPDEPGGRPTFVVAPDPDALEGALERVMVWLGR